MTTPPNPNLLLHGGSSYIPLNVATCPECGAPLYCKSMAWDTETGKPIAEALEITCLVHNAEIEAWARAMINRTATLFDKPNTHQYHQSDWQPVRNAVAKWAVAE